MTAPSLPSGSVFQRSERSAGALRIAVSALLCWLLGALALTTAAYACQICVPRPTETLADRLLQSDRVVLAREDAQRPYHYAAIEILKGEPGPDAIDLFINTPVRRQLAADPGASMLLARDPKDGDWRTFGLADESFLSWVRRILEFADQWIPGETNNLERLQALAPLLGHEDLRLHELAYLEIGRAPYRSIKAVSADVPMERVRRMLGDLRYVEWRGLDILLLGLSGAQPDRARVRREMEARRGLSSAAHLDAWATAYMEVVGEPGLERLADWYFRDTARSSEELKSIIRAMSVQGNNTDRLREPVVAAYRVLLANHPRAAPDITGDLIAWQRWDLAEALQRLQPQIAERDPLGGYAINLYLRRAAAYRDAGKP